MQLRFRKSPARWHPLLLSCLRQPLKASHTWVCKAHYSIGMTMAGGASTFGFAVLLASNRAGSRNITLQRLQGVEGRFVLAVAAYAHR